MVAIFKELSESALWVPEGVLVCESEEVEVISKGWKQRKILLSQPFQRLTMSEARSPCERKNVTTKKNREAV